MWTEYAVLAATYCIGAFAGYLLHRHTRSRLQREIDEGRGRREKLEQDCAGLRRVRDSYISETRQLRESLASAACKRDELSAKLKRAESELVHHRRQRDDALSALGAAPRAGGGIRRLHDVEMSDIVRRYEDGESNAQIAQTHSVPKSMVPRLYAAAKRNEAQARAARRAS